MNLRRLAEIVGSAATAVHALPALLISALALPARQTRFLAATRGWLWVWASFAAPLLVWTLVTGRYLDGAILVLQAVFGVAAVICMRPSIGSARLGLLAGLCALAIASTVGALYSARSLVAYEGAQVSTRIGTSGIYQRLVGGGDQLPEGRRSWRLSSNDGLRLSGVIRHVGQGSSTAGTPSGTQPDRASVLITLDWPERTTSAQQRLTPDGTWTPFSIEVDAEVVAPFAIMRVDATPGVSFDIAKVRLTAVGGPAPGAPRAARQSLNLIHPVLLAHVGVAIAAAAVLTLSGFGSLVTLVAATAAIGWATGARATFVGLGLLLLVPLARRFTKRSLALVALVIALLVAGALSVQRTRATALEAAVPRQEVWATAIKAFSTHTLTGLKGAGIEFSEYAATEGLSHDVVHAHNFWLQLASLYGIFGAIAGLALVAGMLRLAVRRGGFVGLLALVPILALNMIDATLLQGQVLVATTLAINLLPELPRGRSTT